MTSVTPATHPAPLHPGFLLALLFAVAVGFAVGQYWSPSHASSVSVLIGPEDWHGNVRRSNWPD